MLTLAFTASAASLTLKVANPVAVELPADVHFVGVAHRNLPADPETCPGIAAEAEHSQEVPGGDDLAADAAVNAAFLLLAESGRFDVVEIGSTETAPRNGRFAELLLPADAGALCAKHEVDALLVLEGLDSDVTEVGEQTVREGKEVFEAEQTLVGQALWRTYLCDGTLVDEHLIDGGQLRFEDRSWNVEPDVAWEELPPADGKMEGLGRMAGQLQARRLAPSWATVSRTWIPGGSDALKEAAALVKDDDWARAIERWGEAYEASEGKVKGKAALNLAVASERSGDLSLARQWVGLAKAAWEGGPVVKYASELERRWNVNEKVATRTSRALEEGVTESAADLPLALPARRETSE